MEEEVHPREEVIHLQEAWESPLEEWEEGHLKVAFAPPWEASKEEVIHREEEVIHQEEEVIHQEEEVIHQEEAWESPLEEALHNTASTIKTPFHS